MRTNDIKLLWGKSGNRCSICKLEVTPIGQPNSIGEMAHIVARSSDGPRGNSGLSTEERDRYDNLILLCPNHHTEIDTNPGEWTVDKLREIKLEHEKWVSDRLDKGLIRIEHLDNSRFINDRNEHWNEFSNGATWVVVSITPLELADGAMNEVDPEVINSINNISIIDSHRIVRKVNRHHTRPNEFGLINEDLRHNDDGEGYRIQLFRTGHCEILNNLQKEVDYISAYARSKLNRLGPDDKVLRYTQLAEIIKLSLDDLYLIWNNLLPFKDMTFSVTLLNTQNCILYSKKGDWGEDILGYPVESDKLSLSIVVGKSDSASKIFETIITKIVHYFGLDFNKVYDERGQLLRPEYIAT